MYRLIFLLSLTTIISCSGDRNYKNSSRGTGWPMIGAKGVFARNYQKKMTNEEIGPGLVFIEGGTFTMGRVQDDPLGDWNNTPNQQHVMSFYMDETEVTNLMYMEYIDWMKRVFPPENELYKHIYSSAVPDTLVWRNSMAYNESMVLNYLRHPAFSDYPVIGVSWIQAVNFSKWRTDRVNELYLEEADMLLSGTKLNVEDGEIFDTETYFASPTSNYGGNDSILYGGRLSKMLVEMRENSTIEGAERTSLFVQRQDGILLPAYRLPTEAEWEFAAKGLVGIREYNSHKGRKKYPWNGQYTRSGERKTRGDQLANFKQGGGDYGGIAGWSDDQADITAEVKTYAPNDYGLYDMAGNVAEWVADIYRPIIEDDHSDFNYYRGNEFTKLARNEDGTIKTVASETIIYDTLPTGKLMPKHLPGGLIPIPVDEEETFLRLNFSSSDNRNYLDGDKLSKRRSNQNANSDKFPMYNAPIHEVTIDSSGNVSRQFDRSNNRKTLINNKVRVYKGGSWRDREYWLDPAQRRFLPQYMATDFIGFRCAMSKVGAKAKSKKKAK